MRDRVRVRPRTWFACAAFALGAGLTALAWTRSPSAAVEPEARWRNGVIVDVRHCTAAADEGRLLRCAALYCAQRTTRLLTNAQQTRVHIAAYRRDPVSGLIDIEGTLDQSLRAPTLPTGFACHMRDFRRAEPEFVFGHRGQGSQAPLWSE